MGVWWSGERKYEKQVFVAVPNRTQEILIEYILQYIEPATTIVSDCWKAYNITSLNQFTSREITQDFLKNP